MPEPVLTTPALSAQDLLTWNEATASNWRDLLTTHPELLTLPCDIMGVNTIGQLFQHIVAVELRYAERLANLPVTEYAAVPYDSPSSIYATHARAVAIFNQLLASDIDWDAPFEYSTRAFGMARSSRKTILFHALLHGIRHYAQLATLARQHDIKPHWPMDYIFMDMKPA